MPADRTVPRRHSFARARFGLLLARLRWRWHTGAAYWLKRGLDICGALAGLLLLSPLMLAVAAAIRCEDGGPVLFWQRRVGRHGREFAFPKFRSMVVDAEARLQAVAHLNHHGAGNVTFKQAHDPRITGIGRWIRRASVDELPQLWCVLRGDMSLVGPRPPLPREVAAYTVAQRARLEVTPGLTCIWQVSGRADVPFPEQVRMDLEYIRERSPWLDLKLLCRTVPAVLRGRGAY
ncbi:sugar transferase [Ralstonia solanacearum]|nr:sugar transferase [Ralstonia solanacearum]MDB0542234.1 sugar transferase [Ralstonia solanacearum]MDB0552494.1 sugar transferase [Ralstonia solanacearum]MDB0557198.1 sugar transferase [Ralstonia solanacearum]